MRNLTAGYGAAVAVTLRDVRQQFGELRALGPVSLDLAAGEFVALLGPSGCGKSTLLRLIAGLASPAGGTVEAGGRVGFVFQEPQLLPWRGVLSNAMLAAELEGRADRGEAAALLDDLGLGGFEDARPHELSGGMRMRVSLARALLTRPDVLLLDEPFAALDEVTRQGLDDMLRRLWRERGMTVVFVTHAVAEAAYLAQRCVVLSPRPGRVVLDRRVDLPDERTAATRGTAAFAAETARLFEALAAEAA